MHERPIHFLAGYHVAEDEAYCLEHASRLRGRQARPSRKRGQRSGLVHAVHYGLAQTMTIVCRVDGAPSRPTTKHTVRPWISRMSWRNTSASAAHTFCMSESMCIARQLVSASVKGDIDDDRAVLSGRCASERLSPQWHGATCCPRCR